MLIKRIIRLLKKIVKKLLKICLDTKKKHIYVESLEEKKRNSSFVERFKSHEKINVLFYCDLPSLWNSFDQLYTRLKSDQRFDVKIIALPELYERKFKNYDILKFFKEKQIEYIKGYDVDENQYIKFDFEKYDYLFPNRPYDWLRPINYSNEKLRKKVKLCHISYATCMHRGKILDVVCGFQHLHHYDMVFSETPTHTKIYKSMQKKAPKSLTKIYTVGSTKFDAVLNNKTSRNNKFTILYTPRWSLREGTSSFLELYEFFFELAKKNKDISYIFRPHPLMEQEYRRELWKENEWDEFVESFNHIENASIDLSGDYIDTFNNSSILISDMSSMLAEYLLTEKPIIYMDKAELLNEFGMKISKGMYWCKNLQEVKVAIDKLKNGEDTLEKDRKKAIKENYLIDTKDSSEKIKELLIKDFNKTKNKNER